MARALIGRTVRRLRTEHREQRVEQRQVDHLPPAAALLLAFLPVGIVLPGCNVSAPSAASAPAAAVSDTGRVGRQPGDHPIERQVLVGDVEGQPPHGPAP